MQPEHEPRPRRRLRRGDHPRRAAPARAAPLHAAGQSATPAARRSTATCSTRRSTSTAPTRPCSRCSRCAATQTPGEIKQRIERMQPLAGLDELQQVLTRLIDSGLVAQLARRPGQKEERFRHRLSEDLDDDERSAASAVAASAVVPPPPRRDERIDEPRARGRRAARGDRRAAGPARRRARGAARRARG